MFPAPDGNTQAQTQYLKDKGKAFASRLCSKSKKLRNDVWVTTQTTIMKTLAYPMRAICLKKKQWKSIMAPILQAVLPHSGFSRNFPQAVLYGPTEFQGLGMMDPWILQELQHVEVLWDKVTHMDPSGQLFAHELEALRMELGTPDAITDHDYKQFEHCVTYCWLKTLWQFCRQHHFRFDDPFDRPRLHGVGDQYLMHAFVLHHFTPKELAMINQCRMFLKVITLADITMANGKSLHP
jgi:hypothetical protein